MRVRVCWLVAGLVWLSASSLYAKGIFITPGTRANALGGYTGIADDPTAVYWNPAGLARQERSGAQASVFYLANSVKSNRSLLNAAAPNARNGDFPLPKIYDPAVNPLLPAAEPAEFSNKEFDVTATVPFVGGYTTVRDIAVGFGFYGVGGGGGKWRDSVPDALTGLDTVNASLKAEYGFSVLNISAAKDVLPGLSAGIGLDYVMMTDKTEASKGYVASGAIPLASYSLQYEKKGSGAGFQVIGGVMYQPYDTVSAGLVYRSGTEITLTGQGKFDRAGLASLGLADLAFQADFEQHYVYPATYGLGVAYEPLKKLTLALGIERNVYSGMKDNVRYQTELPGVFANTDAKLGYKDTTQFRIGGEYRYSEKLALNAGFQTDPVPLTSDALTLIELNQYDMKYILLGFRYDFGRMSADMSYARGISDKPNKPGFEYEFPMDLYRIGMDYHF